LEGIVERGINRDLPAKGGFHVELYNNQLTGDDMTHMGTPPGPVIGSGCPTG
jgi:hypothetical protein